MSRYRTAISTIRLAVSGAITAIATSGPTSSLIYRKPDDASLELVRLGSHSELGL
jgi:hypothetical protein